MPQDVQLEQSRDPVQLIEELSAALHRGAVIAVPDESGMSILALSTSESGVSELAKVAETIPDAIPAVGISHPSIAFDFVDRSTRMMERLVHRCWPGPVVLRAPSSSNHSLADRWPSVGPQWGTTEAGRAFYCPSHEFQSALLANCDAPALTVVTRELPDWGNGESPAALEWIVRSESKYSELPSVIRIGETDAVIEREGVVSQTLLSRLSGEVFLFVCTGNTCRSPMAEGLFRKGLADHLNCKEEELLDRGYTVISAGLAAHRGSPASPESVELCRDEGVDISGHASQPITEELLFHADHIYTMTRQHRQAILSSYPELEDRVRTVSGTNVDLSDPIGGGMDEYVRCRDELSGYLQSLIDQIDSDS